MVTCALAAPRHSSPNRARPAAQRRIVWVASEPPRCGERCAALLTRVCCLAGDPNSVVFRARIKESRVTKKCRTESAGEVVPACRDYGAGTNTPPAHNANNVHLQYCVYDLQKHPAESPGRSVPPLGTPAAIHGKLLLQTRLKTARNRELVYNSNPCQLKSLSFAVASCINQAISHQALCS